jgi:hypothetical protein
VEDCDLKVEVARLQEQVRAADKALSLADALRAATAVAVTARAHSIWSSALAVVAILFAAWAALHGR